MSAAASAKAPRSISAYEAEFAFLPDDEIVADGIAGRFVRWDKSEGSQWLVMRTDYREPRLAGKEAASERLPVYRLETGPNLQLQLRSGFMPSFEQLTRCDWGTYVIVRGHPARFHQAGMAEGKQIVVVLADAANDRLRAYSYYHEAADPGECAYYCDYATAGLRIGTLPSAPLLRTQAASSLRRGDTVVVNGAAATFLAVRHLDEAFAIVLSVNPATTGVLQGLGARPFKDPIAGDAWLLPWVPGLQVRLMSDRLPTFIDLQRLKAGTQLTIGPCGRAATLQGSVVADGTREFVLVCVEGGEGGDAESHEILTLRFQEAGVRLAQGAAD
jgi:hypothetical protein